eukprot:SAG31_NODE_29458_length_395_cov_0.695946_1_plen_26_part_10
MYVFTDDQLSQMTLLSALTQKYSLMV